MPEWEGKYIYQLDVGDNVLKLTTAEELIEFTKKYNLKDKYKLPDGMFINWFKVATKYDGIEINPYQWKARRSLHWYYPWDIASGCIWNPKAIKGLKLLYKKENGEWIVNTQKTLKESANKTVTDQVLIESIGPVYHGSGTDIDEFRYEFTGQGADQLGSGFYFTTDKNEANAYTGQKPNTETQKLGGEDKPTVIIAQLDIKNPLDADVIGSVSRDKIRKIILRSPILDDVLTNFGEIEYEGKSKVLQTAIDAYVIKNENIMKGLFPLANDMFGSHIKEFNKAVYDVLGYDGIVQDYGNKTHYVAFFPEQIKVLKKERMNKSKPLSESVGVAAEVLKDHYQR